MTYEAEYEPRVYDDLVWWRDHEPAIGRRVVRLIEATLRHPSRGLGRPKSLGGVPGIWSRRITRTHRLFYQLDGDVVTFLQARGHDLPEAEIDRRRA